MRATGGARVDPLPFMPTPDKMPGPSGPCRHSHADPKPRSDPPQRRRPHHVAAYFRASGEERGADGDDAEQRGREDVDRRAPQADGVDLVQLSPGEVEHEAVAAGGRSQPDRQ
jgi:hypothetical protein